MLESNVLYDRVASEDFFEDVIVKFTRIESAQVSSTEVMEEL